MDERVKRESAGRAVGGISSLMTEGGTGTITRAGVCFQALLIPFGPLTQEPGDQTGSVSVPVKRKY